MPYNILFSLDFYGDGFQSKEFDIFKDMMQTAGWYKIGSGLVWNKVFESLKEGNASLRAKEDIEYCSKWSKLYYIEGTLQVGVGAVQKIICA